MRRHVRDIGHRLGNGYVQRADLVVRAAEAGVLVLLEIDRRRPAPCRRASRAPLANGSDDILR
ncbi:hypothetical protein ABZ527_31805 [Streptomyces griseofuscus]|uniref:hypothetical protein n=1 Tax=Streptomyces griseofuscus TaxID=146922 RepID=UPI0033D8430D